MKNSIIASFFIFAAVFFYSSSVYAQTVSPISTSAVPIPTFAAPVPGVSCGNADDAVYNKCCVNPPQTQTRTSELPIISNVLNLFGWTSKLDDLFKYQTQLNIEPCTKGMPSTPGDLNNSACICIKPTDAPLDTLLKLCDNLKDVNGNKTAEAGACENCMVPQKKGDPVGVWTSVGCIRSNIGPFIQETLLGWGVGVAGGISMLCIIYAAFMMQTSGGNAEKVKKAQQLMTSCITGLMLIIFSVFILQLIGVKILRIPGFTQ